MGDKSLANTKEIIMKNLEPSDWFSEFYLNQKNIAVTRYREGVSLTLEHAHSYTRLLNELSGDMKPDILIDARFLADSDPEIYPYFWSSDYYSHYNYAAIMISDSPDDKTFLKFLSLDNLPPARFMIFQNSPDVEERARKWLKKKAKEELLNHTRRFFNTRNEIHWKILAGIFCMRSLEEIAQKAGLRKQDLKNIDLDTFTLEHFDTTNLYDISRAIVQYPALDAFLEEEAKLYTE